jgi:hypothetical protein
MAKLALVASAAFLLALTSAKAGTYEVDNWPGDVDTIPCAAWTKAGDGTWVLNGSIKLGASVIDNVGLKGDAAARKVEKKCGK